MGMANNDNGRRYFFLYAPVPLKSHVLYLFLCPLAGIGEGMQVPQHFVDYTLQSNTFLLLVFLLKAICISHTIFSCKFDNCGMDFITLHYFCSIF